MWDLHPLPWSRRADVGCQAKYSMPRSIAIGCADDERAGFVARIGGCRRKTRRGRAPVAGRRRAAVCVSGFARARLARESRARKAARRADVLQLQSAARSDQRLRRELSVLLVRAAEARRCRRVHDAARAGVRQTASARQSAPHRNPRRQRPPSRSAVFVLRGHAERTEGDSAGHSSQVFYGGRDRVLCRDVRDDRRAGPALR